MRRRHRSRSKKNLMIYACIHTEVPDLRPRIPPQPNVMRPTQRSHTRARCMSRSVAAAHLARAGTPRRGALKKSIVRSYVIIVANLSGECSEYVAAFHVHACIHTTVLYPNIVSSVIHSLFSAHNKSQHLPTLHSLCQETTRSCRHRRSRYSYQVIPFVTAKIS